MDKDSLGSESKECQGFDHWPGVRNVRLVWKRSLVAYSAILRNCSGRLSPGLTGRAVLDEGPGLAVCLDG